MKSKSKKPQDEYKGNHIYAIMCNVNKKVYIGVTYCLDTRTKQHLSELRRGASHVKALQLDFDKYNESAFEFILIESNSDDVKEIREYFYIKLFSKFTELYNTIVRVPKEIKKIAA